MRNDKVVATINGYKILPISQKKSYPNASSSLRNDKVVTVIDGFVVLQARKANHIFLRDPMGVNFTISTEVILKLSNSLTRDRQFLSNFMQSGFVFLQSPEGVNFSMPIDVINKLAYLLMNDQLFASKFKRGV